mmetsp:Transcript_99087/g.159762  ORF Transcript_99087/g.159762 Transcript_99087/m.159762 type:complete len:336 (+) Transcript_99087:1350-2357(+)
MKRLLPVRNVELTLIRQPGAPSALVTLGIQARVASALPARQDPTRPRLDLPPVPIALPEHTRPLKQLMSACNVLPTRTLLLAARAASVMLAIRAPAIHAPRAHLANSRRTLDRGRALTVQQATILTNSLQSSATIVPLIRTHRQEVWNVSVMQDTPVSTSRALRARQERTNLRLGQLLVQAAPLANLRHPLPLSSVTSVAPILSLLQAVQSACARQDSAGLQTPAELVPPAHTRQQQGARHVASVLQENLQVKRRQLNVSNAARILTRPLVVQCASAMEGFPERVIHAQHALLASTSWLRAQLLVPTVTPGRTQLQPLLWNAPSAQQIQIRWLAA